MLDTKSNLVLKIIEKECKSGGYKILDKNDMISALPTRYRCSIEELDQITSYLERQDYITIKYDDENVYCLCLLPFFKQTEEKKEKPNKVMVPLAVFILSFLGSFLGSVLFFLIFR